MIPRTAAPRTTKPLVYFVQGVNGGPVKIGLATDPKRRLANLQNGSPVPLRMIGLMLGGRDMETKLHQRFAAGRLHGEWFDQTTPGLIEFIEQQNAQLASKIDSLHEKRRDRMWLIYAEAKHRWYAPQDNYGNPTS